MATPDRVFVLNIDQKPILAFVATRFSEAQELAKEAWLLEDLKRLSAGGAVLWDGSATIGVRNAEPSEVSIYEARIADADHDDGLALVYLVELDDKKTDATDPGAFPPGR